MRTTRFWFILATAVVLAGQQSIAGTVLGVRGTSCYPPTTSAAPELSVYGDWIENVDRATTTASGVSITIKDRKNGAQNNTGDFAGRGKITLAIRTNGATPGNKTIRLIDDPPLGMGTTQTFDVTITVLALPTVTSVDVPDTPDPFKEITVTLRGSGLQDARDPAQGRIVVDNLIPLLTVGGNASVSSVRVLNSTATSVTAKIFFTQFIQDATVNVMLSSSNACVPLGAYVYAGQGAFTKQVRVKSSNIKNFVKSITFPYGNTFDKNSTATININLLYPAPSGAGGGTLAGGTRTLSRLRSGITVRPELLQLLASNALDNSRVWIQLVPANAFEAIPGGTVVVANGRTELRAAAGDDIIPVTVKIKDCLGGQPGQTNVVKIQTWMHNTNTNQPPNFVEQTFNVRCIQ